MNIQKAIEALESGLITHHEQYEIAELLRRLSTAIDELIGGLE